MHCCHVERESTPGDQSEWRIRTHCGITEFTTFISTQKQCSWDHGGGVAFGTLCEDHLRGSDPSVLQELQLWLSRISSQNEACRENAACTPPARAPPSQNTAQRGGGGEGWWHRGHRGAMGWQARGGQGQRQDTHSDSQRDTSPSVQRGQLHHPLARQPRRPGTGNYIEYVGTFLEMSMARSLQWLWLCYSPEWDESDIIISLSAIAIIMQITVWKVPVLAVPLCLCF